MGFFDLLFANITGAVKVCLILAAIFGFAGMIVIKITRSFGNISVNDYDTGGGGFDDFVTINA